MNIRLAGTTVRAYHTRDQITKQIFLESTKSTLIRQEYVGLDDTVQVVECLPRITKPWVQFLALLKKGPV